ncbi:hypothetical protein CONPUDRAFT_71610 [Coniophora puteana RWD-64-598 SS2]|uniref:Uncharacterized protein n=1 Tax=Coniophora puteana (strain RWD-64-598) TaxID=741705 RepID=A0A5M3MWH8_CONPW|nr:uncharacterized protein CONPUDRAFT_71610 [Coniophora puteana RWD-64-598 SS2]EIW82951.1 hypothetical protein CONPUDRAFT_71610 [Coniophora puteana RWD-64-598 SS2]
MSDAETIDSQVDFFTKHAKKSTKKKKQRGKASKASKAGTGHKAKRDTVKGPAGKGSGGKSSGSSTKVFFIDDNDGYVLTPHLKGWKEATKKSDAAAKQALLNMATADLLEGNEDDDVNEGDAREAVEDWLNIRSRPKRKPGKSYTAWALIDHIYGPKIKARLPKLWKQLHPDKPLPTPDKLNGNMGLWSQARSLVKKKLTKKEKAMLQVLADDWNEKGAPGDVKFQHWRKGYAKFQRDVVRVGKEWYGADILMFSGTREPGKKEPELSCSEAYVSGPATFLGWSGQHYYELPVWDDWCAFQSLTQAEVAAEERVAELRSKGKIRPSKDTPPPIKRLPDGYPVIPKPQTLAVPVQKQFRHTLNAVFSYQLGQLGGRDTVPWGAVRDRFGDHFDTKYFPTNKWGFIRDPSKMSAKTCRTLLAHWRVNQKVHKHPVRFQQSFINERLGAGDGNMGVEDEVNTCGAGAGIKGGKRGQASNNEDDQDEDDNDKEDDNEGGEEDGSNKKGDDEDEDNEDEDNEDGDDGDGDNEDGDDEDKDNEDEDNEDEDNEDVDNKDKEDDNDQEDAADKGSSTEEGTDDEGAADEDEAKERNVDEDGVDQDEVNEDTDEDVAEQGEGGAGHEPGSDDCQAADVEGAADGGHPLVQGTDMEVELIFDSDDDSDDEDEINRQLAVISTPRQANLSNAPPHYVDTWTPPATPPSHATDSDGADMSDLEFPDLGFDVNAILLDTDESDAPLRLSNFEDEAPRPRQAVVADDSDEELVPARVRARCQPTSEEDPMVLAPSRFKRRPSATPMSSPPPRLRKPSEKLKASLNTKTLEADDSLSESACRKGARRTKATGSGEAVRADIAARVSAAASKPPMAASKPLCKQRRGKLASRWISKEPELLAREHGVKKKRKREGEDVLPTRPAKKTINRDKNSANVGREPRSNSGRKNSKAKTKYTQHSSAARSAEGQKQKQSQQHGKGKG